MRWPLKKQICQMCSKSKEALAELNGMVICTECFTKTIAKMVGEA